MANCAHCGTHKPHGHCNNNCEELAAVKDRQEVIGLLRRIAGGMERLAGAPAAKRSWWKFWRR